MYRLSLLKLSNFFVVILWTNICFHIILKKFDQISILLLCGNLEKESLNCLRRQFNFSTISSKWTIMGHQSLIVIFHILLDAHAVQYGINFDNNVETHLTYTK
jgi:hypothetical protein